MSLLANEFDVQSVLHGQVSLAAVNQICAIHEAMNSLQKSKDSLKIRFENVNIKACFENVNIKACFENVNIKACFENDNIKG